MNKFLLFLIGSHFYYTYLFFKNINKDTTPKIGAAIFSAKTIGLFMILAYQRFISSETAPSITEFILIGAVLGGFIAYLGYFRFGFGNFIINYFEKNMSKKLFPLGILYTLFIDVMVIFCWEWL